LLGFFLFALGPAAHGICGALSFCTRTAEISKFGIQCFWGKSRRNAVQLSLLVGQQRMPLPKGDVEAVNR
jgi:hypothetical protein